jgi:hypothetical protein
MSVKTTRQAIIFFTALVAMFLVFNYLLLMTNPIACLPFFPKNDHEITIAIHGTTSFDSIVYGSSPVVAAFKGEKTNSGFVEFGLVYGKITYLLEMLEREIITVNRDIVLGLNFAVFLDELTTDPRYIWHRRPLEPYLYFYRDRVNTFFTNALHNALDGNFRLRRYPSLVKWLYFGVMTDERLEAQLAVHEERFWGLPLSAFEKNLAALERLIIFCSENGIRLRAVWMPYNPYYPQPDIYKQVAAEANAIFAAYGIEVKDMSDAYPREYFYDVGHLNFDTGAEAFTREMDLWLKGY